MPVLVFLKQLFGRQDKTAKQAGQLVPAKQGVHQKPVVVPSVVPSVVLSPTLGLSKTLLPEAVEKTLYQYLFVNSSGNISKTALNDEQKSLIINLKRQVTVSFRESVPRLPEVIPQLLRKLKNPACAPSDFVDIIKKDPSLMAAVLRKSNSVIYNPSGKPVTRLEQGLASLGISGIRGTLSLAVMRPVMNSRCESFPAVGDLLWTHARYTALIAEELAVYFTADAYLSYLVGLVHNIGKITFLNEVNKRFATVDKALSGNPNTYIPLFYSAAPLLAIRIARYWELPQPLITGLEEQITLRKNPSYFLQLSLLGRVLYAANLLATVLLTGTFSDDDLIALGEEMNLPQELVMKMKQLISIEEN